MHTLDLDWAHPEDPALEAQRLAAMLEIDVVVRDEHGPGGGWPVLRFIGPRNVLTAVLMGYDADLDPADHVLPAHTRFGKADGPWGYGVTHDFDCPACVASGASYTSSPRSETYWSS